MKKSYLAIAIIAIFSLAFGAGITRPAYAQDCYINTNGDAVCPRPVAGQNAPPARDTTSRANPPSMTPAASNLTNTNKPTQSGGATQPYMPPVIGSAGTIAPPRPQPGMGVGGVPTMAIPPIDMANLTPTNRMVIDGANGMVIDGALFNDTGVCLEIRNSTNITIRNSAFFNCSVRDERGLRIVNSSNVTIENNYFENTGCSVYAINSSGIKVNNNRFKNVNMGGSICGFVQFNNVQGAGNEVRNNLGLNEEGKSSTEDLISLFRTCGTADSPVIVSNNCFVGGGPSDSGGGIMTGDYNGCNMVIRDNTLINPGQYGIAIAGGHNISLLNNRVYQEQKPYSNVGMYVWSQAGASCSDHTVSGNQVDYTNRGGSQNNSWNAGNCGTVNGWGDNQFGGVDLSGMTCPIDF